MKRKNETAKTKINDCKDCDLPGNEIEVREDIFCLTSDRKYYCYCHQCGRRGGAAPTERGAIAKWNQGYFII